MWPGSLVRQLNAVLPPRYAAAPNVRLGANGSVDVGAVDDEPLATPSSHSGNGVAWQPSSPTLTLEAEALETDEFEVRVYDRERDERLVAAVELVSPANKDRPEHRSAFLSKCAALLRENVALAIVDVVTTRTGNFYGDLLASFGKDDPEFGGEPLYAAALRRSPGTWRIETWAHALEIGAKLPTLPLWLAPELAVPLELEAGYEDACQALRIP